MTEQTDDRLTLSKDIPAFGTAYDPAKDAFDHKVYAESLAKIIRDNPAPLSIGFLGPWGYGKSTVLNLFQTQMRDSSRVVYFNAWKYSNDSFRRQFLLETVEALISDKEVKAKINKEIRLRFFKDTEECVSSVKELLKDTVKSLRVARDYSNFIPFAIAVLMLLLVGLFVKEGFAAAFLTGLSGALIIFAIDRFSRILQINVPIEVNPKLVLPEQFHEEFCKVMALAKINEKKTVFIIDDLDRCPAPTILEILDASKTFLAAQSTENYFIFALDDKAVTTILKTRSENYKNEDVFKFFDVTLRLNPISSADLMEFSTLIAQENGISDEIVDIALYAGFDTPRKIKHFINAYKVVFDIVKVRERQNKFNLPLSTVERPLAKMVALQIGFPTEFEQLKKNPSAIEQWEQAAQEKYGEFELASNAKKEQDVPEKLLNFIWTTKNIHILDVDGFLHLKIPAYAVNLPYTELKDAIINKKLASIETILPKIDDPQKIRNLVKMMLDLLDKVKTPVQMSNVVSVCLEIRKRLHLETYKSLSTALFLKIEDYKQILDFNVDDLFEVYQAAGAKHAKSLILMANRDLRRTPSPQNAARYIELLHTNNLVQTCAKEVNEALQEISALNRSWIADTLSAIPEKENWKELTVKIPSKDVLKNMLSGLKPGETDVNYLDKVISVLIKFWDEDFAQPLTTWIHQRLSKLQSTIEMTPDLDLILKTIDEMPAWLSGTGTNDISIWLLSLAQRVPNAKDKARLMQAYTSAAHSANADPGQTGNQVIGPIEPEFFKDYVEQVSTYKDRDWWKTLFAHITSTVIANARTAPNHIWAEKFAAILNFSEVQSNETTIKQLLGSVLTAPHINSLTYWEKNITVLVKLEQYKPRITELLKGMLDADTSTENKIKVLEFYKTVFAESGDLNPEFGGYLFGFLEKPNTNSLKFGVSQIEYAKELLGGLFPTRIEQYLQKITEDSLDVLVSKRDGIKAVLDYQDNWSIEAIDTFVKLLKKIVSSANEAHLNMATALFTSLKKETLKKASKDILDAFSKAIQVIQIHTQKIALEKAWGEKQ